jgi:3' terminal RNA ribose 2'-O-methyltransferase Hen1
MLLTITNTQSPATDLGYLLHKNPSRLQSFDLSFGRAHVFYPEATDERCSAALLLDVDPVGLVRNRRGPAGEGYALEQYVNDRPYVASSFLSVAISQVFGSALAGRSKERESLVDAQLPLRAAISVLPCRGGEEFLRRLFEPLGYEVTARRRALDEQFPEWGESQYFSVELQASCRVRDLLSHLYVLIPVLDNDKHYWVGDDEVEKLLRHGASWLSGHPEREMITRRYLKHRHSLVKEALSRLVEEEDPDEKAEQHANEEAVIEERISLNAQRIHSVVATLLQVGVRRVIDLGCGEGKVLRALLEEKSFTEIAGMDVSYRALEIAQDRLRIERLPQKQKDRIRLMQGSLTYRDKRLAGYDAATVIEVIEHLDPPRLSAFERVLFEFAKPGVVVMTTPNVEYNVKFEGLPAGKLRHKDHRFEWTRGEFQAWATAAAERFGYSVRFAPIGPPSVPEDEIVGAPTQMAVFTRKQLTA